MSKMSSQQEPEVTGIKRFVALSSGEFWRAKEDGHDGLVKAGEVLMLANIDEVDDQAHTVIVRLHPSKVLSYRKTVKYLVDDFLASFEHVTKEDAKKIRDQEMKQIQGRIEASQSELEEACANPDLMDKLITKDASADASESALPVKYEAVGADVVGAIKTQRVTALMARGLTEQGIEQIKSGMEHHKQIAERRADWIQERTSQLSEITAELTPFFEEKAAVALALTQGIQMHVKELMKGISSLNLYVLKDVDIMTIKEGQSADPELKLSVTQRVLYMDEELAVWAHVHDQWDYRNERKFFDALCEHPGLVQQIFPTERSVVSIAATRKNHDYNKRGYSTHDAARMALENQKQLLLIRDGDNIHVVISPELFHNYSETLFPTTDEMDGKFKGYDGEGITYSDINYTDSLKSHEAAALGYKRLLILLCGLDHNKKLFGEFYPGEPSLSFVSLGFQEKYFHFIHDVDGRGLVETSRPEGIRSWAKSLNQGITSGSRVLIQWRLAFSPESIPSCFEKGSVYRDIGGGRSLEFEPETSERFIFGVVKKRAGKLMVQIPVSGSYQYREHREFNAWLDLSYVLDCHDLFSVLCLDRLKPEDARWYLHDRPSRELNVPAIRMVKHAVEWVQKEHERTKEVRGCLLEAVTEGGLTDSESEGADLVNEAVSKWMCAHPSKDLNSLMKNKRAFNALCDQMYSLTSGADIAVDSVIKKEKGLGREPVRVTVLANGHFAAYSTALEGERDDRLLPFYWLSRTVYRLSKKGVSKVSGGFVLFKEFEAKEAVKYQREDFKSFIAKETPFLTPKGKDKALSRDCEFRSLYGSIMRLKSDVEGIQEVMEDYLQIRREVTKKSTGDYVVEPETVLPMGHLVEKGQYYQYGFLIKTMRLIAWLVAGNEELERLAVECFSIKYEAAEAARSRMESIIEDIKGKELHEIFVLSKLDKKSEPALVSMNPSNYCDQFEVNKLHPYSLQMMLDLAQSSDSVMFYTKDKELGDLDEYFGIKQPDNYQLLLVREGGTGFDKSTIQVFDFNEELYEKEGRWFKIYTSWDAVEKKYSVQDYTTVKNGKGRDVTLRWKEIENEEFKGYMPKVSYGYEDIGGKVDDE